MLAAILAGGRSSRFGRDKAAALFDDRPLLDHMRDLGEQRADAVVVVGRDGGVPDLPGPGLGPLGGIAGALAYAAAQGFETVLTLPCDMPRLPAALLDALLRRAPSVCSDAPVIGHWPAALAPDLLAHLARSERRSVIGWARAIGALPVASPEPLANINTPADLAAL
ncbi:MAG: amino acid ABC transporter substrate-binding protein [Sphingomonas sp.]|nr:MAG: amino acid ABC transporter substrate-binding protein [Sphingomonas sp.]